MRTAAPGEYAEYDDFDPSVCVCNPPRDYYGPARYCHVCKRHTDMCGCSVAVPPCTCERIDVDLYDPTWCQLCGEDSEYNIYLRERTPRKPAAVEYSPRVIVHDDRADLFWGGAA